MSGDCGELEDGACAFALQSSRVARSRLPWARNFAAVASAALLVVAAGILLGMCVAALRPAESHRIIKHHQSVSLVAIVDEDSTGAGTKAEIGLPSCHLAVVGDDCWKSVVWAMTSGIKKNSTWYPGLSEKSTFEDFQAHLSLSVKETKCQKPCPQKKHCETAGPGSPCHDSATWAMTKGIEAHPEWYKGLSSTSPFEAFQDNVHKFNETLCPHEACNPVPFKLQTLFCWAVVRSQGYELSLMNAQLAKKAGIFACDGYVVLSDAELGMTGVKTLRIASTSASGSTVDGTSPNAPIFVDAWHAIRDDGAYKKYDWVIKVDPDTVLIPERLRLKLAPGLQPTNPYPPPWQAKPSAGQWVPNCDKMASWGGGWSMTGQYSWPMMYGAVEVISRAAIDNYFGHEETCKGSIPWQGMGEDAFMGLCLRTLQAGEIFMKQGDGNCGGGACTDASFSAYHPHKDIGSWFDCWGQAMR